MADISRDLGSAEVLHVGATGHGCAVLIGSLHLTDAIQLEVTVTSETLHLADGTATPAMQWATSLTETLHLADGTATPTLTPLRATPTAETLVVGTGGFVRLLGGTCHLTDTLGAGLTPLLVTASETLHVADNTATAAAPRWWEATAFTLRNGHGVVQSGAFTDTYGWENTELVIAEEAKTPGFDAVFTFENVLTSAASIRLVGRYQGATSHHVSVYLRVYPDADAWTQVTAATTDLPTTTVNQRYDWPITVGPTTDVWSAGQVQVAIRHTTPGVPTHTLHLDQLILSSDLAAPITAETPEGVHVAETTTTRLAPLQATPSETLVLLDGVVRNALDLTVPDEALVVGTGGLVRLLGGRLHLADLAPQRLLGTPSITRIATTGIVQAANGIIWSFASLPPAGCFVAVQVWADALGGAGQYLVTDNQGNTYTQAVQTAIENGRRRAAIFFCPSIGTPSGTFTLTFNPQGFSTKYCSAVATAWLGLDPVSPLDQIQSTVGGATTTPTTGATPTTTAASELVLAVLNAFQAGISSITVQALSPAWVQEGEVLAYGSPGEPGEADSRLVSSTGAYTATWTIDTPLAAYSAAIATFKASATNATLTVQTSETLHLADGAASPTLTPLRATPTETLVLSESVSTGGDRSVSVTDETLALADGAASAAIGINVVVTSETLVIREMVALQERIRVADSAPNAILGGLFASPEPSEAVRAIESGGSLDLEAVHVVDTLTPALQLGRAVTAEALHLTDPTPVGAFYPMQATASETVHATHLWTVQPPTDNTWYQTVSAEVVHAMDRLGWTTLADQLHIVDGPPVCDGLGDYNITVGTETVHVADGTPQGQVYDVQGTTLTATLADEAVHVTHNWVVRLLLLASASETLVLSDTGLGRVEVVGRFQIIDSLPVGGAQGAYTASVTETLHVAESGSIQRTTYEHVHPSDGVLILDGLLTVAPETLHLTDGPALPALERSVGVTGEALALTDSVDARLAGWYAEEPVRVLDAALLATIDADRAAMASETVVLTDSVAALIHLAAAIGDETLVLAEGTPDTFLPLLATPTEAVVSVDGAVGRLLTLATTLTETVRAIEGTPIALFDLEVHLTDPVVVAESLTSALQLVVSVPDEPVTVTETAHGAPDLLVALAGETIRAAEAAAAAVVGWYTVEPVVVADAPVLAALGQDLVVIGAETLVLSESATPARQLAASVLETLVLTDGPAATLMPIFAGLSETVVVADSAASPFLPLVATLTSEALVVADSAPTALLSDLDVRATETAVHVQDGTPVRGLSLVATPSETLAPVDGIALEIEPLQGAPSLEALALRDVELHVVTGAEWWEVDTAFLLAGEVTSDTVVDTRTANGVSWVLHDADGTTPALDVQWTFTRVPTALAGYVRFYGYYNGAVTDAVKVQQYHSTLGWVSLTGALVDIPPTPNVPATYVWALLGSDGPWLVSNTIRLRFLESSAGVEGHTLAVDELVLLPVTLATAPSEAVHVHDGPAAGLRLALDFEVDAAHTWVIEAQADWIVDTGEMTWTIEAQADWEVEP